MPAAPTQGGNNNTWGTDLNTFLAAHTDLTTGLLKTAAVTGAIAADDLLRYSSNTRGASWIPSTANVATINAEALRLSTAGGGTLFFEPAVYKFATPIIGYSNVTYDGLGSRLEPTAAADSFQSLNFDTYSTTATQVPTSPYRITLKNWLIYQPSGLGRNCVSLYCYAPKIEDCVLVSQSVGSALWTEYGSTTEVFQSGSGTGSAFYGDARLHVEGLMIIDNPSTSAVNVAPSANDFSANITGIAAGANPVITTNTSHFLTVGQTVIIASVGGATECNGSWTVLATPSNTTFTITLAAHTAYTSGGTAKHHVSAAWCHLGPHDSLANSVIVAATGHVAGRRGILLGTNGNASSTGQGFTNLHIYDNFDVALDSSSGNCLIDDSCQIEGSYKCVVMLRNNGQCTLHGDVYGGQGGVVLLFVSSGVNEVDIRNKMFSAGSGLAPASGFANCYFENYGANGSVIDIIMEHGYATTATLTTGSAPSMSRVYLLMDAYGGGSITGGWGGAAVDSTHWLYYANPKGDPTSAQVLTTGGTIATNLPTQTVAPAGAVTGVILQSGSFGDDRVTVVNESAFTVTFAASGTSHVADGVSDVIAAITARSFVWDSSTNLWYRSA